MPWAREGSSSRGAGNGEATGPAGLSGTDSTSRSLHPSTTYRRRLAATQDPDERKRVPTMESKLTTRSQEAVAAAQRLAAARGQAALEPVHLLVALMEQSDGIAGPLLRAVGAGLVDVRAKAEAALRRM